VASPVVQLRVPEDMLAAVDGTRGDGTRSAWILSLIERELLGGDGELVHHDDQTNPRSAASPLGAIPDSEPSGGAVCATPRCWQRDTRLFGLRKLPLCPACRAALEGRAYQRETPPGAARLIHHGVA
jgi:hypothetical protein